METDLADLSYCSLSCRSVDGDLTRASNDLRSTPDLRGTCTNLFSIDFRSWTNVWMAAREGERKVVGGTKGEPSASPCFSCLFGTWRQETLGFLAPGAWRIAEERGRRERETWEK